MTEAGDALPGRDLAAYLSRYPEEIAFADDPGTVFDRYHEPGFVMINDGLPLDRERLVAHARGARKRVAEVRVSIEEAIRSGDRVAARYVLTALMAKGQRIATEIFLFGRLAADGRLRSAHQLTRSIGE
jgi:hypothetical protein